MDSLGLVAAVQEAVQATVDVLSGCEVTLFAPPTPTGGGLATSDITVPADPVTSGVSSLGDVYVTVVNGSGGALSGTLSKGTLISLDGATYTVESTELRGLGVRIYLTTAVTIEIADGVPLVVVDDDFQIGPIPAVNISQKSVQERSTTHDLTFGVQVSGLDLLTVPLVDWRVTKTDLAGHVTHGNLKIVDNPGTVVLLYVGDM